MVISLTSTSPVVPSKTDLMSGTRCQVDLIACASSDPTLLAAVTQDGGAAKWHFRRPDDLSRVSAQHASSSCTKSKVRETWCDRGTLPLATVICGCMHPAARPNRFMSGNAIFSGEIRASTLSANRDQRQPFRPPPLVKADEEAGARALNALLGLSRWSKSESDS